MAKPRFEPLKGRFEVIAFYGPAGTGKSMRVQTLAQDKAVDLIVDDGLVISRGRILAGRSAKTEENMVRAIRRAMFHFPEHRREVRACLAMHAPCRVMVLATSTGMASDICTVLGLPQPAESISIDQVATPDEIKQALFERKQNKRHVIPAATTQIRKNFTGRLVGHLRSLFGGEETDGKTIVRPPFSFFGTLRIAPAVHRQIVSHVIAGTKQVVSCEDLKIKGDENLAISLSVKVSVGDRSIREVVSDLTLRIRVAVEQLTGTSVSKVNVAVKEVVTDGDSGTGR